MIYWSLLILKRIDARSKEDDKSYISTFYFITSYITNSFCWCDLSYVQYSSKDPCCSLACDHRRISGRRFSSPKWVERSDDRKYVCVRSLAVPKRHNICSSSSSLATFSTCNHAFPQAGWHYSKGTKGFLIPNPFKFLFQILVLFQLFLRDSCVEGKRDIYYETFLFSLVHHYNVRLVSVVCLSTVKSVYTFKSHMFLQPYESFTADPYMDCITRC